MRVGSLGCGLDFYSRRLRTSVRDVVGDGVVEEDFSCVTMPICALREDSVDWRVFVPSVRIVPWSGS